jgi:hypothetical protein
MKCPLIFLFSFMLLIISLKAIPFIARFMLSVPDPVKIISSVSQLSILEIFCLDFSNAFFASNPIE